MPEAALELYEDLNCPFCYALSSAIHDAGLDQWVRWRGIQHAPDAPIPWTLPGPALRNMLESEVASVQSRCPLLPIATPHGQANTRLATLAVAEAYRHSHEAGTELRQRIKRGLFVDNQDISDSRWIAAQREQVGLPALQITHDLEVEVQTWQANWENRSPRMIPTLVYQGGERPGLGDPEDAIAFVRKFVRRVSSVPPPKNRSNNGVDGV